jgi:hypothetical protein
MKPIVIQEWEETERGWGCRPDGFSLHLTIADAKLYAKKHWDDEKKLNTSGGVPDEYTRECGSPQLMDVEDCVYEAVETAKKNKQPGVRVWCRDLKKLAAEFKEQTPTDIANDYAKYLDKDNDVSLMIWVCGEAPKEFLSLAGVDKHRWLAYVPVKFVKQKLPLGKAAKVVLLNSGELRFFK